MEFEEFLNKRKNKQFTITETADLLKELGYKTLLVETHCKANDDWGDGATQKFRNTLDEKIGKTYFAYIKFYIHSNNEIYALVAGKTNSWNDDVHFVYGKGMGNPEDVIFERSDKAKKWLCAKRNTGENFRWYHEKVLVVLSNKKAAPENNENLAYSIEDDIGGLLGLFRS